MRTVTLAIVAGWIGSGCFAANPAGSFIEQHCADCHDAVEKKGGLDLTALKPDFADAENFARWVTTMVRVHWPVKL